VKCRGHKEDHVSRRLKKLEKIGCANIMGGESAPAGLSDNNTPREEGPTQTRGETD